MADEMIDWVDFDAFVNADPDLYSPAAGHDMQGVGHYEAGGSMDGHEQSHYKTSGNFLCTEEHCKYSTKRFTDLRRHIGSKHCTRPTKKYSCLVLWCKYSGNNGFARKDKLKSHYKTVHGGSLPGKANQPIKPKVDGTA